MTNSGATPRPVVMTTYAVRQINKEQVLLSSIIRQKTSLGNGRSPTYVADLPYLQSSLFIHSGFGRNIFVRHQGRRSHAATGGKNNFLLFMPALNLWRTADITVHYFHLAGRAASFVALHFFSHAPPPPTNGQSVTAMSAAGWSVLCRTVLCLL